MRDCRKEESYQDLKFERHLLRLRQMHVDSASCTDEVERFIERILGMRIFPSPRRSDEEIKRINENIPMKLQEDIVHNVEEYMDELVSASIG